MRVRHRIPSIFNLSMVDVLCCALGCVILLWLINLREAKHHQDSAEEQHRQITLELADIRAERDKAYLRLKDLEAREKVVITERDGLQKSLRAKEAEAADLAQRLKKSAARVISLESDLDKETKRLEAETARAGDLNRKLKNALGRAGDLERRLKDAAGRVASLEKDLSASERRGEKESERGRTLSDELATARMRLKELRAKADLVPSLRADLKEAREQYAAERALANTLEKEIAKRMRDLKDKDKTLDSLQTSRQALERDIESRDKELALTRRSLAALREENKTLQQTTAQVRAAAENRFAGITLTGRRVLFLIDTSGSMELVDENTKAPTKWADVRNTVARVMRSLSDLQKFQVIVFAEKASFLFSGEEDWLDYRADSSPQRVVDALAKITPKGGTNTYAALQLAFRLRAKGLDTIYLLSDGLPNLGDGVSADTLNALKEGERHDLLARHIRRTLQSNWNRRLSSQPRVRINTIGFFYESPDVGAFLWALARENDGSFVGMSKP